MFYEELWLLYRLLPYLVCFFSVFVYAFPLCCSCMDFFFLAFIIDVRFFLSLYFILLELKEFLVFFSLLSLFSEGVGFFFVLILLLRLLLSGMPDALFFTCLLTCDNKYY